MLDLPPGDISKQSTRRRWTKHINSRDHQRLLKQCRNRAKPGGFFGNNLPDHSKWPMQLLQSSLESCCVCCVPFHVPLNPPQPLQKVQRPNFAASTYMTNNWAYQTIVTRRVEMGMPMRQTVLFLNSRTPCWPSDRFPSRQAIAHQIVWRYLTSSCENLKRGR